MTPDRHLLWIITALLVGVFMASVFWVAVQPYGKSGPVEWGAAFDDTARRWCLVD